MNTDNRPSLLVVDDDPAFNRILVRALEHRGFRALGAHDSAAALRLAQQEEPEFVVLDLNIGGESGLRLIQPLLEVNPDARVLVLTGYASIATAVEAVLRTTPDVVLLDVHLPGGGGTEVIKQVHAKNPDQKFLALSVSDAAEDVIGVIRAGARGYITKSIKSRDLVDAIIRVADGDAVFSPRLAGFVLDAFSGAIDISSVDEELDRLSNREREVLRLIARGYAYKEIAKELFISVKTVETHVSSVLRKLQLSNRHQLTRWATDRRLV